MTNKEKAKIILEKLDEDINVNWAFEEYYIRAIISGLNEIERLETKKA